MTPPDEILRFITCGSVDDGKSTLMGRLLLDSGNIPQDHKAAMQRDTHRSGQDAAPELAWVLDGLQAEREQGITIDVAYRYFASARRRYIMMDAPGHDQYTRNMATAASTADVALLLVDARKGLLAQTRRHARVAAMMGVRNVLLVVNKMDLVDYSESAFNTVAAEFKAFAANLGLAGVQAMPVSALLGDNVLSGGAHMPWYRGASLMQYLDALPLQDLPTTQALRLPVQWVNRPHADFRGLCGRLVAGEIRPGDALLVLPSGNRVRVDRVFAGFSEVARACAGDAVTVTLLDAVDVGRGDMLVAPTEPPQVADQFEARLLWMASEPLMPGRPYWMKLASQEVTATVTAIKYVQDIDNGAHLAARTMAMNQIGTVTLSTHAPVVFEPYRASHALGGFVLIDKTDCNTAAAGMIEFALRRSDNIRWQALQLDQAARAAAMGQAPRCIWFTGLSGSGKSTIANLLDVRLHAQGQHTYLLDGDNVRHGLNRDLGFTEADRVENIRRVAEVARLMVDAGLIVLVSFISPYRSERRLAREMFAPGEFLEVFVDTPLAECERRDTKGLYAKARAGQLKNFTGIDSAYEPPDAAEVHLHSDRTPPELCVEQILARL
jgi:bifunctional enzyme CysN/CysC